MVLLQFSKISQKFKERTAKKSKLAASKRCKEAINDNDHKIHGKKNILKTYLS